MSGRRDAKDIGRYRRDESPMQVVSGPLHAPTVRFEAPPSPALPKEMKRFIQWFEHTAPKGKAPLRVLARAGIAHLYFVSIHPFEDGNGRIGRAIAEKAVADFSSGTPADGALFSPLWAIGLSPEEVVNLDSTHLGLLFCCPALPLSGRSAKEAIENAHRVFRHFGFTPYMTLNIVNTKAILCVLNLVFDRRESEQVQRAHRCIDTLFETWASQGIYPYRLGVQSMWQFVAANDPYWQVVRALKDVFDPSRIIAPGRYNLV